jgi:hypothetical protein
MKTWSQDEINLLQTQYSAGPCAVAILLGRSCRSVANKASRLGISQPQQIRWNEEQIKFLKLNYASQGAKIIAQHLNISSKSIRDKAHLLGLKQNKETKCRTWKSDKSKILLENYSTLGSKACAELLHMPCSTIKSQAGHRGLLLSLEARHKIVSDKMIKYWENVPTSFRKVDANNFINCNTKEAAYILGLLWADGYLNNKSQHYLISLELQINDFEEILPTIKKTGEWGIIYRKQANRQPQGRIFAGQRPLYLFLQSNDYEVKSIASAHKILNLIPEHLKYYWWRGYFDGDGCFYYNKKNYCRQCSFAGSYAQNWTFAENLLQSIGVKYRIDRRIQKSSKHSVVRITNIENIKKFGNYIYQQYDGMGLNRKYIKFNEIIA